MAHVIRQGLSLAYSVRGRGEGVVLIHGLGSRGRDFEPQAELLSSRFRVVVPDLRGHGLSSRPHTRYTMRDLSADVAAIIEATDVGACHVVGLSLGGMIAFQLALDAPRLVRTLTIVNSGPEVVPKTLAQRYAVQSRLFAARFLPMPLLGKQIGKRLFPHPHQADLRANFRVAFSKNDRASYRAALSAIVGWSVAEHIDQILVPTLVVTGDRDYTSVELKQRYAERIPNASVTVIEDSGHATPIDQAARFNEILVDFLENAREAELDASLSLALAAVGVSA